METEVEETIEAEANIEEIGDMGLLEEGGALTRARMTDIGHKRSRETIQKTKSVQTSVHSAGRMGTIRLTA